eukprot:TRINITY_DN9220_c0_g1_i1.p1 TRINITY_DN9220_c0_g1~~TRINITY_DN9220_c0_g1_i1.p1  ORF type:complete len:126 (-),score=10.62 TRINITY_DN9220_c0_g1_i1:82-459(-)
MTRWLCGVLGPDTAGPQLLNTIILIMARNGIVSSQASELPRTESMSNTAPTARSCSSSPRTDQLFHPALDAIFSSTVPLHMSRMTSTSDSCPNLCSLAIAWVSRARSSDASRNCLLYTSPSPRDS